SPGTFPTRRSSDLLRSQGPRAGGDLDPSGAFRGPHVLRLPPRRGPRGLGPERAAGGAPELAPAPLPPEPRRDRTAPRGARPPGPPLLAGPGPPRVLLRLRRPRRAARHPQAAGRLARGRGRLGLRPGGEGTARADREERGPRPRPLPPGAPGPAREGRRRRGRLPGRPREAARTDGRVEHPPQAR